MVITSPTLTLAVIGTMGITSPTLTLAVIGTMGIIGDLHAGEILEQLHHANTFQLANGHLVSGLRLWLEVGCQALGLG